MKAANSPIDEFRSNPRLRVLVYACLAIITGYLVLGLSDQNARTRETVADLERRRAHQQQLAEETEWVERRDESRRVLADMQARAWSERTAGLAEAAYKDFLNQQIRNAGLSARELSITHVRTEEPAATDAPAVASPRIPPGFGLLRARLQMDLKRDALFLLLATLQTAEHASIVRRMRLLNPAQRVGTVELELEALVRESPSEQGDSR